MWAEKKLKNHWKFTVVTEWEITNFWYILGIFSTKDDPIELKPLP